MPRALRIEYTGACYHVMCRGDRQENIFLGDSDRELFLSTLDQVCVKTGWFVHAYVLMPNHYHLVVETPEPNLVAGMHWFQGTYTARFNRRNHLSGHLFQGRYKALAVDAESKGYLLTVCNYVHLNPARARLLRGAQLREFQWSSLRHYIFKRYRPDWLRVDRVLGELGLHDMVAGRRRYGRYLDKLAEVETQPEARRHVHYAGIRRGWCLGSEDFRRNLLATLGGVQGGRRRTSSHSGGAAFAHDEDQAVRLVQSELAKMKLSLDQVRHLAWSDPRKRHLARVVRQQTVMKNAWVGTYLGGGHESTVSRAVHEQG